MYSDRLSLNGLGSRKRSVKDRLGTNMNNGEEQFRGSKRFQGADGKWRHDMYDDTTKSRLTARDEQISTQDLRFKLQKNVSRGAQGSDNINGSGGIKDLREKLSGPLPPPRAHTQAVSMPQQGSSSVVRAAGSTITKAPAVAPTVKPPAPALKSPLSAVKASGHVAKPPIPSAKPSTASKVSTGAAGMTVANFLQSLDLSKYLITFQAEEIDMSILRVMKDDELKELGIPMGPRKKIALALASQSKH